MLSIENANKTFLMGTPNERVALKNMNLELADGEFVTVVGSNGAGKSTLFNAICGNFLLDSGKIMLGDTNITFLPEHKRSKMIGRVFQDPMKGTAPHMTIEENLALAYSRSKRHMFQFAIRKSDRDMYREYLSRFSMGLENRMDEKVGLLSGGQRQVVTLLMCTVVAPKLLLLDEHTAALDPATAQKVMEITKDIVKSNNLTTMMITHNLQAALDTGNRTIMLDDGEIILDIKGKEREDMTIEDMLNMYSVKRKRRLDNDRMLLV